MSIYDDELYAGGDFGPTHQDIASAVADSEQRVLSSLAPHLNLLVSHAQQESQQLLAQQARAAEEHASAVEAKMIELVGSKERWDQNKNALGEFINRNPQYLRDNGNGSVEADVNALATAWHAAHLEKQAQAESSADHQLRSRMNRLKQAGPNSNNSWGAYVRENGRPF